MRVFVVVLLAIAIVNAAVPSVFGPSGPLLCEYHCRRYTRCLGTRFLRASLSCLVNGRNDKSDTYRETGLILMNTRGRGLKYVNAEIRDGPTFPPVIESTTFTQRSQVIYARLSIIDNNKSTTIDNKDTTIDNNKNIIINNNKNTTIDNNNKNTIIDNSNKNTTIDNMSTTIDNNKNTIFDNNKNTIMRTVEPILSSKTFRTREIDTSTQSTSKPQNSGSLKDTRGPKDSTESMSLTESKALIKSIKASMKKSWSMFAKTTETTFPHGQVSERTDSTTSLSSTIRSTNRETLGNPVAISRSIYKMSIKAIKKAIETKAIETMSTTQPKRTTKCIETLSTTQPKRTTKHIETISTTQPKRTTKYINGMSTTQLLHTTNSFETITTFKPPSILKSSETISTSQPLPIKKGGPKMSKPAAADQKQKKSRKSADCLQIVQKYKHISAPGGVSYTSMLGKACIKGNLDIVRCMLALLLVDIDYRWENQRSPVMEAAIVGQEEMTMYLIGLGCELAFQDQYNQTLLHLACIGGSVRVVKTLVENKHLNMETPGPSLKTPFLSAAFSGRVDVMKYMISKGCNWRATDANGRNALHIASHSGHLNVVRYLISMLGKDSRDGYGSTPLMLAAMESSTDVLAFLKERGSDINAVDRRGSSALCYACAYGNITIIQFLLDKLHLSINERCSDGRTLLMEAARNKDIQVLQYLIGRGCNLLGVDDFKNNLLHIAASRGRTDTVKKLLASSVFDINAKGQYGSSPIGNAILGGHWVTFKLLLLRGADLFKAGKGGDNALHIAVFGKNIKIMNYLLGNRFLDIDGRGENGLTPIMLAAQYGKGEAFMALAKKGADVRHPRQMMKLACAGRNRKIISYLVKRGGMSKRNPCRKVTPRKARSD